METLFFELEKKIYNLIIQLNCSGQENKKLYLSEQRLVAEKEVLFQQGETTKQKVEHMLNKLKSFE